MEAGNGQVVRKARLAIRKEGSSEIGVGPAHSSGPWGSWEQRGQKRETETQLRGAATPALLGMESRACSTFSVGLGDHWGRFSRCTGGGG